MKVSVILLAVLMLAHASLTARCGPLELYHCTSKRHIAQLERKMNVELIGSGFVKMSGANVPSLHFTSGEHVNVDQARKMYLTILDAIVRIVDLECDRNPVISSLEFSSPPAELMLSYFDSNDRTITLPYIAFVSTVKGRIYYHSKSSQTSGFDVVHEEDAVTALAEYRESHPVRIEPQKTLWKTRGCRRH